VSHPIGVTHPARIEEVNKLEKTKITNKNISSMPISELLKASFVPDKHYHLVFKSIDGVLLFRDDADYTIFLERFYQFTDMVFDNWAYCLLNNHAHFIIKAKPLDILIKKIRETDVAKQTVAMKKLLTSNDDVAIFDEVIERQVNSFMVSFANYTKNKHQHHGGLFQKPFKRIAIDTDAYLQQAIIYVHANAVKHQVCMDYTKYRYSSYTCFTESCRNYYVTQEVVDFFGGMVKFIELHEAQIQYY
jgi:putative transposase